MEGQGESAEVEEPQPALPHPPVVIDHQRLLVNYFISPILFSVALFSVLNVDMQFDQFSIDALYKCGVHIAQSVVSCVDKTIVNWLLRVK